MSRAMRFTGFMAGAVIALCPLVGSAQEAPEPPEGFPERPLEIIVPYGTGGGSDQLSRAMANAIEEVSGTSVQVTNKPGGGGLAAIPDFMAAPKDGYTMLESIDAVATNYAAGRMEQHPTEDIQPLAIAQITFNQLYIRPNDDRFSNFEEFVAYAQDNPGKLTVANVGNQGSMERINMFLLEQDLDFETKQIAFDEPSERYASVIGGHIDALFEQPGDVRQFLEADRLKPIVTFFDSRPSAFSEVPTHSEVGADFTALNRFRGFWTHPDVPEARKAYLEALIGAAWQTDSFQEFNRTKFMHLVNSYRDSEGATQLINNAIETYTKVYEEIGIETRGN